MPWQVEISAKWQNYFGKAEEMLNISYPLFMNHRLQASCAADVEELPERFITFGINGRKMLVDFLLMTQLRVDNKKSYRICPPKGAGSALFLHADQHIRCFECGETFVPMLGAPEQISDCRYCGQCWPKKTEGDNADVNVSIKALQTAQRSAPGGEPLSKEVKPLSLQKALYESTPHKKPMKVLMEGTDQDDEAFEYSHPVAANYRSFTSGWDESAKIVGDLPKPISLSNELGALGY